MKVRDRVMPIILLIIVIIVKIFFKLHFMHYFGLSLQQYSSLITGIV